MADESTKIELKITLDARDLEGIGKTFKVTFDDEQISKFTGAMESLTKEIRRGVDWTQRIHTAMKRMTHDASEGVDRLITRVRELNSTMAVTGATGGGGGGGGGGGAARPGRSPYLPYRVATFDQAAFTTVATGGLGGPSAVQQALWTKGLQWTGQAGSRLTSAAGGGGVAAGIGAIGSLGAAVAAAGLLGAGALAWHGWSRGNQLAGNFLQYERQRMEAAPFVQAGTLLGDTSGFTTGQPLGFGPTQALGMVTQASMGMYRGFANNRERQLMFSAARARGISAGTFGGFIGAAERTGTYGAATMGARTLSVAQQNLGLRGQAIVDHFQEMTGFLQQQAAMGQKVDVQNLLAQQAILAQNGIPGYLAAGITTDFAANAQRVGMTGMQNALDVRLMRAAGYTGAGGAEGYAQAMLDIQHAGRDPGIMFRFFNQLLGETGTRGTQMGALAIQRAVSQMGGHIGAEEARIISGMNVTEADVARIGNQIGGYDGKGLMRDARSTSDQHPFMRWVAGIEGREIGIGADYAKNTLLLREAIDALADAVAGRFITQIDALTQAIRDLAESMVPDGEAPRPVQVEPTNPETVRQRHASETQTRGAIQRGGRTIQR